MKYILILLVSFAFGQTTSESYKDMITKIDMEKDGFVCLNENSIIEYRFWKQPITTGMVLDYAEECYNDSTTVTFGYYNNIKVTSRGTPTFEGFIEWLKR